MSSTTAKMLVSEASGQLIPQYYDPVTDSFVAQEGIDGAACVTQVMSVSSALAALGATTKIVAMAGYPIPSTMILKSADATRKIEFSVDGGVEYFQPAYDVTSATMLVTSAKSGISHVKFTALTADTWSIG